MSPATLLRMAAEQPFEPFRLHLSDGTHHDITHPESLAVGTRTTMLWVADGNDPDADERAIRVDTLHITRTVPLVELTGSGAPSAS